MSGFSAQWLALREPADHRSVNRDVRAAFVNDMAALDRVSLIDIGCGSGSHLRSLSPHLGPRQFWRLVDYDAALLAAARENLGRWADKALDHGDNIVLFQGSREIEVAFLQADLSADLSRLRDIECDAVTAAAFFDLVSAEWIAHFATAMAARRKKLYTVLTYDGREIWTPPLNTDAVMLAAFHAHQATDKGFGAAAGPHATQALANGFRQHGYDVMTGPSPWLLSQNDRELLGELAKGSAGAVAQTGKLPPEIISQWLAARLNAAACETGHLDLYARPR